MGEHQDDAEGGEDPGAAPGRDGSDPEREADEGEAGGHRKINEAPLHVLVEHGQEAKQRDPGYPAMQRLRDQQPGEWRHDERRPHHERTGCVDSGAVGQPRHDHVHREIWDDLERNRVVLLQDRIEPQPRLYIVARQVVHVVSGHAERPEQHEQARQGGK